MCCTIAIGTGRSRGERRDQLGQRRRTARRHPDHDHVDPLGRAARAAHRARGARRPLGGPCRPLSRLPRLGKERGDPREQLRPDLGHRRARVGARGFQHVVRRAERQRVERDLGAARGERREHDHGQAGPALADLRQRREPVHHRHRDVEDHDVGVQPLDVDQGDRAVGGHADDLDLTLGLERLGDEPAHDDGVVDDQDPGSVHQSCSTRPTSPSFSASASFVIGLVAYSSTPAINAWKI